MKTRELEQRLDRLIYLKEQVDHFSAAMENYNSDPSEDYGYMARSAAFRLDYYRETLETEEKEYQSLRLWLEFFDAESTKKRFNDYYGCGTKYNEAARLHGSMFIAQKRSEQFLKQGAIYVASLHAKKAADTEWLLFQECN